MPLNINLPTTKVDGDANHTAGHNATNTAVNSTAAAVDAFATGMQSKATLVVAPSGYTGTADYACTGTADQDTINTAIAALGTDGGKIILREGQYNCSAPVIIDKDYVDFEGACHTMWGGYLNGYQVGSPAGTEGIGGAKLKATTSGISLIELQNLNDSGTGSDTYRHRGIRIASLYLYGNSYTGTALRTNYSRSAQAGDDFVVIEDLVIQKANKGIDVHLDACSIRYCSIQDIAGDGITHTGNYGQITNNLVYDIGGTGIVDGAFSTVINANTVGDCLVDGISSTGACPSITGNAVKGIKGAHIRATGAGAAISGNSVDSGDGGQGTSATASGIYCTGAAAAITGNTVTAGGSTTGYGIRVTGQDSAVVGNALRGGWNGGASTTIYWVNGVASVANNGGDNATGAPTGPAAQTSATLLGWWKANAITGFSNGATLTSWLDSSNNGYALTPPSGGPLYVTGALNSLPVARFNGTADNLRNTSFPAQSQPITVFVVAKETATGATRSMLNSATSTTAALFISSGGAASTFADSVGTGGSASAGSAHVFEAVHNSSSSSIGVDGSLTTVNPGTAGWGGGVRVGSNAPGSGEFFNGDIAEVVVYAGSMNTTDRSAVRAALGTKYGITVA